MADNAILPFTGTGDNLPTLRLKDRTGVKTQIVALDLNPAGAETLMAGVIPISDGGNVISVDDNGSSITVDGTVAISGVVPVSDNATSLTVDGTVAVSSVASAPATDKTTDHIGAALLTNAIMNDLTALTPKFAKIACAASGNNTIVAAVAAKKIRVLSAALVVAAATNIYFVDGAGSPVALFGDSTNKVNLAANGGFVLPFNPVGWFETSTTNVALNLNLSAANTAGGGICYVEV